MHALSKFYKVLFLTLGLTFCLETVVFATAGHMQGSQLSLWWGVPFLGFLASLAFFPILASHFWHFHYGKIAAFWSILLVVPLIFSFGFEAVQKEVFETVFHHYFPFIIIIGTLYTISGGIKIDINSKGTPLVNTTVLAIGTILAGWIGTTGASMLLIRPLIQINIHRSYHAHLVVFFIFLVGNIGGSMTPLGDPPLFIGFLNGVDFFWPLRFLLPETLMISIPLLCLFYVLDRHLLKKDIIDLERKEKWTKVKIQGKINFVLFIGVIFLVLMSGVWKPKSILTIFNVQVEIQNLIRDIGLIIIAIASYCLTDKNCHRDNQFSWKPLVEVTKLFFAIFITVIPVIAILNAGLNGGFAPLIKLVSHQGSPINSMYFWLTGFLSAFLDNAPTYIVFFHMAGGDAQVLMSDLYLTLEAISLGAVFMGAMTYIGNAPNFMVKAIAEESGFRVPSFFGYMLWSVGILVPLFIILTILHF